MKSFIAFFLVIILWSCSVKKDSTQETLSQVPKIWLECDETIFDDQGIPKTNVLLFMDGEDSKIVGETTGCDEIDQEDFENFDIPNEALSAVGGWFAGAGDYFYVSYDAAKQAVRIFHGWQEEEQPDNSYHWEIHKTIRL